MMPHPRQKEQEDLLRPRLTDMIAAVLARWVENPYYRTL